MNKVNKNIIDKNYRYSIINRYVLQRNFMKIYKMAEFGISCQIIFIIDILKVYI